MGVGGELFILVKGKVDLDYLSYLRQEVKRITGLTDEGFSFEGPMKVLAEDAYEHDYYSLFTPLARDSYTWISVNTIESYYDIGYERGDISIIIKIAEWLEEKLPTGQIYYGDDTGGALPLFDECRRTYLLQHYRKVGYR
jgi:hypothetical protein